jgi:hypothetical protein
MKLDIGISVFILLMQFKNVMDCETELFYESACTSSMVFSPITHNRDVLVMVDIQWYLSICP